MFNESSKYHMKTMNNTLSAALFKRFLAKPLKSCGLFGNLHFLNPTDRKKYQSGTELETW